MPYAPQTPSDRYMATLKKAQELSEKGILSREESRQLEAYSIELDSLQSQIKSAKLLDDHAEWANQSQGMPPLASHYTPPGNARVVASYESGAQVIEQVQEKDRRGIKLLDGYGEGLYDGRILRETTTNQYRDAFKTYVRGGIGALNAQGVKTLQVADDQSGGFLVPADILDRVIAREPTPTRVAGRVTQLMTSRDQLIIPKLNYTGATDDSNGDLYTSGIRTTWTGEIPASSTTMRVTEPIWGQLSIPVYTAMLSIPITNNMIEDATFPIVSYISGKFAEAVDLLRDYSILKGTGQGQPAGILNNVDGDVNLANPVSVVTGSASAITATGLINLGMSLPEQYDENAVYVMNKTSTGKTLAGLQDGNQRYIWGSGLQDSGLAPGFRNRMILGYPVIFSGFMPNEASNAYPVIFGDLSAYYLVNRIGFSVQVLRELYAETNQVLVLGRIRFGGTVAEPWKIKVNKCST